ncbi:MAG TPA: HlyD family secretion protein [Geobacteraceae bacterium]
MAEERQTTTSPSDAPDPAVTAGKTGGSKKRRAGIILAVLLLAGGVAGGYLWVRSRTHISTDDAFIETHIYSISSRGPGTVANVLVRDNQDVKKGDFLVDLDPNDYRLRVNNASAELEMARNETSGDYAKVEGAKASLALARAKLDQAELDLQRGRNLFQKEVIPKEQLDRLETARRMADSQVREAEESVRKEQALVGSTPGGGREARIRQKQAKLDEAELNLSYVKVSAPADGFVTRKAVEPGNNVQAGQALMALVSLEDAWVTANYKESQLTHVRPGQEVSFTVDTYPGKKFRGTVESIMAGTGAAFSLLPPENATGNYVKVVQRIPVKISIDKGSDPEHLLRVGMSVVPTIVTERSFIDALKDLNPFR